jgi:hypothetical protein
MRGALSCYPERGEGPRLCLRRRLFGEGRNPSSWLKEAWLYQGTALAVS